MKHEQGKSQIAIHNANLGRNLPKRKLKWRRLEQRITHLKDGLRARRRNLQGYWSAVTQLLMNFD